MESVVNVNTKNTPARCGVIIPPNDHYKPVLYSHIQATKDFNAIDHDLYTSMRKAKKTERHKTPAAVFWMIGLGVLAAAFPFVRKMFKK